MAVAHVHLEVPHVAYKDKYILDKKTTPNIKLSCLEPANNLEPNGENEALMRQLARPFFLGTFIQQQELNRFLFQIKRKELYNSF
jgi:hypothetical protein